MYFNCNTKAKENQKLSEGRGKKGCQKSDKVLQYIDAKLELATLAKVKEIEEQAPEEVKEKLKIKQKML